MEQRALYRISIIVWMVLFASLLTGCEHSSSKERITVPDVYANTADTGFATKDGITTFHGQAFSGNKYSLFENGDTAMKVQYYKGKQEGVAELWYENKQTAEIRYYTNGKKTGVHKGWYASGKEKFVYHMQEDHFEGNVKEWFEDGQLFRDFNYVNGQEEGMQHMYWPNGKIRANYQSLNGRKYGLTGVKNCVSVWTDSVSAH